MICALNMSGRCRFLHYSGCRLWAIERAGLVSAATSSAAPGNFMELRALGLGLDTLSDQSVPFACAFVQHSIPIEGVWDALGKECRRLKRVSTEPAAGQPALLAASCSATQWVTGAGHPLCTASASY